MATSQLLQSLNTAANQMGKSTSDRRTVETFLAGAAIDKRDAVSFDMAQTADSDKTLYVQVANTGADATKCFVGVALEAAAAGDAVRVCIGGICQLNCTATAAGVTLSISGSGGRCIDFVGGSVLQKVAVACEAHSGNKATVIVLKQF
jgi:hypothetical protein